MRLHVGVGAPLARLPVYAVLDLFVDIEHDRFWWWHGAALTAALLITLAGGCRAVPRLPQRRSFKERLARLPSWLVALDAEVLRQSDRAGCLEPVVSMAVTWQSRNARWTYPGYQPWRFVARWHHPRSSPITPLDVAGRHDDVHTCPLRR